jgi:hypothetical protein
MSLFWRQILRAAALHRQNVDAILRFKLFHEPSPPTLSLGDGMSMQWPVARGLCPLRPVPSVPCPRTLGTRVMLVRESRALFKHRSQESEARGQRASDQHPATSASSGQRPEHQSPEPSTFLQPRSGMVQGTQPITRITPKLATASRPPRATRSRNCLLGEGAPMRARGITPLKSRRFTATSEADLGLPREIWVGFFRALTPDTEGADRRKHATKGNRISKCSKMSRIFAHKY